MTENRLAWQSKLILLAVLPAAAIDVLLKTQWWAANNLAVALWTIGLSLLLAVLTRIARAATAVAALTGLFLTASLIFSTARFPYQPWHTALLPLLAVSVLAAVSTRIGRTRKLRLGAAEQNDGRSAAQIAANLGAAMLFASEFAQSWVADAHLLPRLRPEQMPLFIAALAALAEAAADTVSSEIGQLLSAAPRMITTLCKATPGADGAISLPGTTAGIAAAILVSLIGTWALGGSATMAVLAAAGAVFGLFFDSLLGATFERTGWLNNDAVNFLSTVSAAAFALAALSLVH